MTYKPEPLARAMRDLAVHCPSEDAAAQLQRGADILDRALHSLGVKGDKAKNTRSWLNAKALYERIAGKPYNPQTAKRPLLTLPGKRK